MRKVPLGNPWTSCRNPSNSPEAFFPYTKRVFSRKNDLLLILTSNRSLRSKQIEITLAEPFRFNAERDNNPNGSPYRDRLRTRSRLLAGLWRWFKENPKLALIIQQILTMARGWFRLEPRIAHVPSGRSREAFRKEGLPRVRWGVGLTRPFLQYPLAFPLQVQLLVGSRCRAVPEDRRTCHLCW